ncbi:MAG: SgcJ/EcaC family oxidoreductase [Proteobacteria bacterium]|nr:SgcJ/EcaC family oxidoreductase [Pseudomonadota bacterium]
MTNKNLFQLLVGFFTVVLLVASCTSEDGPNTEADTAAINAIWSTYVSSLEAGDIDAWLSLWTEDGVQMPPNEAPVIGKDKLRQRNGAALDLFTVTIDITNQEVEVAEKWAFSRGVYSATFTPKDGSQPIPVDGKFMTILRRQTDGGWKIHRDIFNSSVAPDGE